MSSVMTIDVNLAVVAIIISALSALAAWATYSRAGDWRQTDAGKETALKLAGHNDRLTRLETRLENIATKEDMARLQGQIGALKAELDGVRSDASKAAAGVERIEQFLMDASQP